MLLACSAAMTPPQEGSTPEVPRGRSWARLLRWANACKSFVCLWCSRRCRHFGCAYALSAPLPRAPWPPASPAECVPHAATPSASLPSCFLLSRQGLACLGCFSLASGGVAALPLAGWCMCTRRRPPPSRSRGDGFAARSASSRSPQAARRPSSFGWPVSGPGRWLPAITNFCARLLLPPYPAASQVARVVASPSRRTGPDWRQPGGPRPPRAAHGRDGRHQAADG